MTTLINTDKNIIGNERLEEYLNTKIEEQLQNYNDSITRIEVHLSDERGNKVGVHDKRCLLEARLENRQPISVIGNSNTTENAINHALIKLRTALKTATDRSINH